ncbi:hypothetical protein BDZ89DRAFT_1164957 [Hymenopellis radicata]|nr:hypothetical protein BDZ89DRAFT_1164957 [Hymenopellis radicata]
MSLPLPPELVYAIMEYLLGDKTTLRSCALVARAWSGPSQQALFHQMDLSEYPIMRKVLAHLTRHPHLRTLIRHISLSQLPMESRPVNVVQYSTCVATLLRCLPHLTSINVTYISHVWKDLFVHHHFPKVLADFLRQSSVTILKINGLDTQYNIQQALSSLEGTQIKQAHLIADFVLPPSPEFTAKVVRLPYVEFLRLGLRGGNFTAFQFWFSKPQTTFPCLKHCELVAFNLTEMTVWLTWFRQSTLRLDSLRVELKSSRYVLRPPTDVLSVFDGLHCMHLQLYMAHNDMRPMVEWWSSAFQFLANSGATIHFTELTFAFPYLLCVEAISNAWSALDGVLSHNAFSGVQKLHFQEKDERTLITDLMHPELASDMRRAMPGLASRGVLDFS